MNRGAAAELAALARAMLGPDLDGALCSGRAPEHDHDVPGEDAEHRQARLYRAEARCGRCPALDACRAAVLADPSAAGVWAGLLRTPTGPAPRTQLDPAERARRRRERDRQAQRRHRERMRDTNVGDGA